MGLSQIRLENYDIMNKCMAWDSCVTASYQFSLSPHVLQLWYIDMGLIFSVCLNGFVRKPCLSSGNDLAIYIMTPAQPYGLLGHSWIAGSSHL